MITALLIENSEIDTKKINDTIAKISIDLLDLTIVIPVKNEEQNLPNCLAAIGKELAKSIVVVDSGSTDNTRKIAESFGAKVVDFAWNGQFPKKRNWLLRNFDLQTKWVFFLDADEYLTDDFKAELRSVLNKDGDCVGYWLSYTVYFLGKKLKGGYPLRKLALFKVGAGEYEHIAENQWSQLDMEVHEHPVLAGKVGLLKSKIDHQDFRGVSNFVLKHNEYASWEASRFLKAMHESKSNSWTWKQQLKYWLMGSIWMAPAFFFGSYVLCQGFLDGTLGFAHAVLRACYYIQVYCKIKENTSAKMQQW
ncbi:MAG: glycosyl transferase family 2 [Sphingobacteriales bacterium]|nr:glycosyl transferase family 2 [Sphingobacteriales bacterium]